MPQVKPTPAAESVLGLDGEDTLSERGSVGSKQGPGLPDDGGEETSSSSSSAGSKRKRDSLSFDRVQLDEPEVTRSISSDSTWSVDSHPPSKSRKKNGHSEPSVSSGAFIGLSRGVLRKRNKHSEPSVSSGALISRPRGVLRKRHPEPSISKGALIGRPRGVLRLRKLPHNVTIEGGTGDSNVLQSNGISKPPHFVRRKNKRIPHTFKENRDAGDDTVSCSKTENGICGQESTEDDLSVETQSHLSGEPSKPVHVDEESLGDDDVNLEENAARMLCSLSDICADPPRKRMNSPDRSNAYFRHSNRSKGPYNKVKDAAHPARLLRKRDDKVTFRKRRPRRHFYEVSPHDIDPLGIVKERIRVFWPLDETWYFGLVKEYNPVTRLHHVKYDDKDEEWINIKTERIKLLLLPGEGRKISNRNKSRTTYKVNYEGDKKENMDGNSPQSSESEPIISWLARSDQARSATSSIINKPDHLHSNIVPMLSNSLNAKQGKLCSNDAIPGSVPSNGGIEVHNDGTTFEDRRFRFVYSRKRFPRTRNGFLNISEHVSNPKSRENSADFLGSVIGREASTETDASVKYVMLLLSQPLKSVYKLRSEAFSGWVSHSLFHPQHGSLVALWPAVCLDILLVDDALGLKHLLLETCLRSAVSLFCLLAGSFNQYSEQSTLKESKTPCTSVRFQISGLHGRNQVVFVLFSFFGIGKSQWKNLQSKLRYHSLKKELSKVNCTYANIKHLTNGMDRRVSTSTNLFSKCLSLDVRVPQFRSELSYPDVDPVIFCLDGQSEFAKKHMDVVDVVAAPLLLLCHHLKLLIESNLTSDGSAHQAAPASGISSLNANSSTDWPLDMGTVGFISHSNHSSRKQDMAECSVSLDCNDSNNGDINGACNKFPDQNGSYVPDDKPCSSDLNGICSPQKSKHPSIDIPRDKTSDSPDEILVKDGKATEPVSNLVQELNERPIGSATPTAPRTSYHRNRFASLSRTFGDGPKLWPEETISTGFAGGSKKPRSHVSYSVSPKSDELGLKHKGHFRKTHSSIKINGAKRLPDNARSGESSPESLACVANVLVTVGDRGWREYDTQITIDTDGQSDRRICVRLAEGTKYAHKVCQVLQPGATNRYTHAMLWKGGPEWYLEFPDRSQWLIFKQMHDECYSHNIRAACVKNIPIPGVRLVDGHDDNVVVSFVRPQGYLCHIGPDVKIALDESRVIYDMDSDDEDWISRWKKNQQSKISTVCELTDDMFERVVDKFEKLAHTHNCNELTLDQMKELDMDNVPLDIIELIHDYWHDKRQTKGMPLVRHFQSALWKIYEQQLQEWESAVDRIQGSSNGYQGKRLPPKPALFAFCLKPRGLQLQIPSKGPKQRSHKKLMYSGCHSFSREHDGFYRQVSGRKYSEYVGDGRTCESYDGGSLHSPTGHSPRFSMRTDSPRAFDAAERGSTPRFVRTNSVKRNASVAFSEDNQQSPSFRNQKIKRGAPDHWKTAMHEYQNSKHLLPGPVQGQRVDVEELKLRDATSAAQHAATMARLKRERAHCLMHKADLAVHRASVAVMIADAIRASSSSRDPPDEEC